MISFRVHTFNLTLMLLFINHINMVRYTIWVMESNLFQPLLNHKTCKKVLLTPGHLRCHSNTINFSIDDTFSGWQFVYWSLRATYCTTSLYSSLIFILRILIVAPVEVGKRGLRLRIHENYTRAIQAAVSFHLWWIHPSGY
jgi:hypothetical protein